MATKTSTFVPEELEACTLKKLNGILWSTLLVGDTGLKKSSINETPPAARLK
jgi:hypothetical protein